MQAVLNGETEMPSTLAPPPPPPKPLPPPPPAVKAARSAASAPTPVSPARQKREAAITRPAGPERVLAKPVKAPLGLLVGVAAACLILGVLLTVVAMKVFVR